MDDSFIKLQQRFITGIPERLAIMLRLCEDLGDHRHQINTESLEKLHRELHKLAGAAACYQWPDIKNCAESFESWLDNQLANSPHFTDCFLNQLLGKLKSLQLICTTTTPIRAH